VPKPTPYKIVVPLFDDEDNLINLLNSLVDNGICPSIVIVSMSGPRGNIDGLVEKYGFHLVYSVQRQNPSITRNRGADEVDASYIVFLDSDVLVTKMWKDALDEITSSGALLLTGDTVHVSATPNWLELYWFDRIERGNRKYLNGANIVVDKGLFEKLKGFDESLNSGEDYDFSIRAANFGAPPVLNARFKVFHEGYPKSIKEFVKRERWHASGDLGSLKAFLKSNVIMVSSLYMVLVTLTLFSLVATSWPIFSFSVFCLLLMSLALTIYKVGWRGKTTLISAVVMNLYLMGRGSALIEKLSRPIINLFNRNRF
jgi:glycosyltransferase involved in cell wall biosynthesis